MNPMQSQTVAAFVAEHSYWLFLGLLLVNLLQRPHLKSARRKRLATLYLAIAALVIFSIANLLVLYGGNDLHFLAGLAIVVGAIVRYRDHAFPFRLRCARSGRRLDMRTILYRDSNILPQFDESEATDAPLD